MFGEEEKVGISTYIIYRIRAGAWCMKEKGESVGLSLLDGYAVFRIYICCVLVGYWVCKEMCRVPGGLVCRSPLSGLSGAVVALLSRPLCCWRSFQEKDRASFCRIIRLRVFFSTCVSVCVFSFVCWVQRGEGGGEFRGPVYVSCAAL